MDLALYSVGIVLVSAVLLRISLLLVSAWRQSVYKEHQRQLALELLRHRVRAAKALRVERERTELSWDGYRKFVLQRKIQQAHNICSFYLVPHDRKPLPPFKPGQYLTFKLNIPGLNKPLVRCYSLSQSPNHRDYYRVSIKKILPPPDRPEVLPGSASTFFHDQLREGDILDVKAPSGKFFLDLTKEVPVVLIAGGIGITPLLSMLNSITEGGSKREVWFFYGVRSGNQHFMKEHLAQLNREFDNLHLQVCYSQPTDKEVLGRDYDHAGYVSVNLLRRLLPSSNYEFYICSPPHMMGSVTRDLKAWGVPDDKIFFEFFGPATVKETAPPAAAASPPGIKVTFAKCGKSCVWNPKVGSLLEFAEENGVTLDFGCRAGNCGTCLTAIKSGEVTYMTMPGEMPEAGSCLTCISVPKSDLTLDA